MEAKRKGYQWPASAITNKEMEILVRWRKLTGASISELVRWAIERTDDRIKTEASL